MRLNRWRSRAISLRLWCGFVLVLALLVAIAGFSLERLGALRGQADELVTRHIARLDALARAQDMLARRSAHMRDLVAGSSFELQRASAEGVRAAWGEEAALLEVLRATDDADAIAAALPRITEREREAIQLAEQARYEEAKNLVAGMLVPDYDATRRKLRDRFVGTMADARVSVTASRESYDFAFLLIPGGTLLALVVGLGAAVLTTRSVIGALAHAREAALRMAQGDLTKPLDDSREDEIGQVVGALEWMRSSLADSVGGIRAAAASVRASAQRIEGGSAELAGRTEQQASGLEETASSMEEFTATVQQNADSAGQGSTLALQASDAATRGGEAVRAVVRTMEGIQQSSGRIGEIIGVIDGIAFQTNILALNAAVEAARAGEQGRGFAVVAGEVRALAQRSAQAAREIKGLIGESAGRVGEGVREVASAGATMDGVVGSVQQVSRIVADIALASREQLAGIQQVNAAISHMDGHTQQNAVLVEQAASAAADLSRQAEALVQAVARFRLEEEEDVAPPFAGARTEALHAPQDTGPALLAPA